MIDPLCEALQMNNRPTAWNMCQLVFGHDGFFTNMTHKKRPIAYFFNTLNDVFNDFIRIHEVRIGWGQVLMGHLNMMKTDYEFTQLFSLLLSINTFKFPVN